MEKSKAQYNPAEIEPKWQEKWAKEGTYEPDLKNAPSPFYNLMMFPYPSAEGLHVGNMYAFTGTDIYGRFKRLQGLDVFEPIGLDGFGIHSENYALKVGKHPAELAKVTEKRFYEQLRVTGNAYAWKEKVETYDPDYYKWTQWIFVQMFKHGLAYRGKASVNWCPKCLTVLADEQVVGGECERCSSLVEKKELEQWFFKITDYAERLLKNLEKIDWSEKIKIVQKNWIGKSEGAQINFAIKDKKEQIEVFTTRPDTLFGATFLVIAPEHPLVNLLLKENKEVMGYVRKASLKSQIERIAEGKKKTGVNTSLLAVNPVNNQEMPVWVADYVVMDYGTGAIMAVPAHDERDFKFAKEYDLPIIQVISGPEVSKEAYTGAGKLINSHDWDGLKVPEEMDKVLDSLEKKGWGKKKVHFHLRDWLISRQRYWGPPIPMIHCQKCGWVPEKEENLPVLLPEVEDWKPKGMGQSPLASIESFVKTKCPCCGGEARRETDVSDTFLDSAWYFLRYPSVDYKEMAFNGEITKKWLPVDMYIGGAEHAVLHLLYTRFVTMALKDWGFIDFEEPFKRFRAHGLLIKDGAKMSKSKGNVVNPDDYIRRFGADTLRAYLMFLGPFEQGGDFRDTGIAGMNRFLRRIWQLAHESVRPEKTSKQVEKKLHQTAKKVTSDLEALKFNTAIASMMEFVNLWSTSFLNPNEARIFLQILAPFAPHITEELWVEMGEKTSIHQSKWPEFDKELIEEGVVTIIVQVNGKTRATFELEKAKSQMQSEVEKRTMEIEKIQTQLAGRKAKSIVFVPGKLLNIVV